MGDCRPKVPYGELMQTWGFSEMRVDGPQSIVWKGGLMKIQRDSWCTCSGV